ncbi:MAG: general secretion pathway protein GspK [Alphaproteobacteria bacterium]|nr:general secretion pathway protein GspK [Alphaproteobacteria bacterium]
MRRLLAKAWHELVRPRGVEPHRFSGVARARRSKGGIALLMVITTVALMTVMVTEINYAARVRLLMSAHARDEVAAEQLARSGINIYRLILMADKQISSQIQSLFSSMGGDEDSAPPIISLWEMIPMINTGLMRMLFVGGGDIAEEDMAAMQTTGQVSQEVAEESREAAGHFSGRSFIDFSGDFFAEVQDENRKINVNLLGLSCRGGCTIATLREDPVALILFGMMSGYDNDEWFNDRDIEPWDLIGNLADWVDQDDNGLSGGGGRESNTYQRLDSPYLAKNAQFRTNEEIRLVEGWQDEVYERFGEQLTTYATTINLNTASDELLCGLARAVCATTVTQEQCQAAGEQRVLQLSTSNYTSANQFRDWVNGNICPVDDQRWNSIKNRLDVKSSVFQVTSTGALGDTTATITAVLDFSSGDRGRIRYWRVD